MSASTIVYPMAAETVAGMCHWGQNRGGCADRETHEQFHFGYSCPYEAMAAVLRGEPDPRDGTTTDSGFLTRVRAEERQRIADAIMRHVRPTHSRTEAGEARRQALLQAARVAADAGPVGSEPPTATATIRGGYLWRQALLAELAYAEEERTRLASYISALSARLGVVPR